MMTTMSKEEFSLFLDYDNSGFFPSDRSGYVKLLFRFQFSAETYTYLSKKKL